jgi:Na+-translocating ferredoxin:NAD+ oxidoreductase RnfG subunit
VSNETPGFGDKIKKDYLGDQFKGAPAGELVLVKTGDDKKIDSEIVAISGATVSSEAVVKTFNVYIDKIKEQLRAKGLI